MSKYLLGIILIAITISITSIITSNTTKIPYLNAEIYTNTGMEKSANIRRFTVIVESNSKTSVMQASIGRALVEIIKAIPDGLVWVGRQIVGITHAIFDGITWTFGKIGDLFSAIFDGITRTVVWIGDLFSPSSLISVELKVFENLSPEELESMKITRRPKLSIDVSIPSNEAEYAKIFGSNNEDSIIVDATSKMEREFLSLSDFSDGPFESIASSKSVKKAEDFYESLESNEYDYSAIIGHNEDGYFKFADGLSVSIDELSKKCHEKQKFCIFISCDSREFNLRDSIGIGRKIKYREALSTVQVVSKAMSRIESNSIMDVDVNSIIQKSIDIHLAVEKIRPRVKMLTVIIGGAPLVSGVLIEIDNSG